MDSPGRGNVEGDYRGGIGTQYIMSLAEMEIGKTPIMVFFRYYSSLHSRKIAGAADMRFVHVCEE